MVLVAAITVVYTLIGGFLAVSIESIRALCDAGQIVITCGGGGIPVVKKGNALCGVPAVIDKDFASAKLAQLLNADCLIILTAVEKVAINFNKPDQKWLSEISVAEAKKYIEEGHFAPGSMLPKVQAAIQFAESNKASRASWPGSRTPRATTSASAAWSPPTRLPATRWPC